MSRPPYLVIGVLSAWFPRSLAFGQTYQCSTFQFPASSTGQVNGLNNAGYAVGYYGTHGFIRNPQGGWLQIDYPGATATQLFAINNSNTATGEYIDSSNATHYFTIDSNSKLKPVKLPPPSDKDAFKIY